MSTQYTTLGDLPLGAIIYILDDISLTPLIITCHKPGQNRTCFAYLSTDQHPALEDINCYLSDNRRPPISDISTIELTPPDKMPDKASAFRRYYCTYGDINADELLLYNSLKYTENLLIFFDDELKKKKEAEQANRYGEIRKQYGYLGLEEVLDLKGKELEEAFRANLRRALDLLVKVEYPAFKYTIGYRNPTYKHFGYILKYSGAPEEAVESVTSLFEEGDNLYCDSGCYVSTLFTELYGGRGRIELINKNK